MKIDSIFSNFSYVKRLFYNAPKAKFLIDMIENEVEDIVSCNHPTHWTYEDHISELLVKNLSTLFKQKQPKEVRFLSPLVLARAYKQSGKLENRHGDIAIVVNITFSGNEKIQGVGFLEAKKRDLNSKVYRALQHNGQLSRFRQNSPFYQVLLYDYELYRAETSPFPSLFNCAPIENVIQGSWKRRDDFKTVVPFSWQLICRYFQGFDLDRNMETLDRVLEKMDALEVPEFLLVCDVFWGTRDGYSMKINEKKWKAIIGDEGEH